MGKTYRTIGALQVAGEIMDTIRTARMATADEIASKTGIPKGTVLCHLETLKGMGWVDDSGGLYRIGLKMALFWAAFRTEKQEAIGKLQDDLRATDLAN